jgi:hypothetical protein
LRIALAGGLVAGALAVSGGTQDADAAQSLVACAGGVNIGSANPTVKAGDAEYAKVSVKKSDGTKFDFLVAAPIPIDATTCIVDAGIRTNQAGQDVKYVLDNQSGGHTTLTMDGALGKLSGSLTGSISCNNVDLTLDTDYPTAYPLQGKLVYKFDELDAASKQIQIQAYVRLGGDTLGGPPDHVASPTHITIDGTVIKGPGVSGDVSAHLAFSATTSTKNVNVLDCVADPSTDTASLGELWTQASDGDDAGTTVDNFEITIPS